MWVRGCVVTSWEAKTNILQSVSVSWMVNKKDDKKRERKLNSINRWRGVKSSDINVTIALLVLSLGTSVIKRETVFSIFSRLSHNYYRRGKTVLALTLPFSFILSWTLKHVIQSSKAFFSVKTNIKVFNESVWQ